MTEIDLRPLPRDAVAELVDASATARRARAERVIAAADGNPLLALESARAAAAQARPAASLRGLVRAAVARLPGPARDAAELAAVAGRDLDRAELAALAEPDAVARPRSTAACSAPPTAASASATRCCARPSTATSTTRAAGARTSASGWR